MEWNSKEIERVYDCLQDDISRFIFEKRLMYSMTGDLRKMHEIIWTLPGIPSLRAKIHERKDNFLFGAGAYGKLVLQMMPGYWQGVLDNELEKSGKQLGGVTIVPPNCIKDYPESIVFLAAYKRGKHFAEEMHQQLRDLGVEERRIVRVDQIFDQFFAQHPQYFDLPELPHADHETFVDVGCSDGESSQEFVNWAGAYRYIYAFEAAPACQAECRRVLSAISPEKTMLLPYGAWSERTELCFTNDGLSGDHVSKDGEVRIPTVAMDEVLADKQITYIKMDIEGAEEEALRGAEHIIREHHPKLAICVYHRPEDIVNLPIQILSYASDYRFYLRHYSFLGDGETVLYAF